MFCVVVFEVAFWVAFEVVLEVVFEVELEVAFVDDALVALPELLVTFEEVLVAVVALEVEFLTVVFVEL